MTFFIQLTVTYLNNVSTSTPHIHSIYTLVVMPKYRTNPSMNCSYKGAECTTLVKLKTKFQNSGSCDETEGLPYKKGSIMWPQPFCINATVYVSLDNAKTCPGEDAFWTDRFRSKLSTLCYTRRKQSPIIISSQTTKGIQLCDEKVRSCKTWGPWLDSGCSISNYKTNQWAQTRYRYCKQIAQCVLIEVEAK